MQRFFTVTIVLIIAAVSVGLAGCSSGENLGGTSWRLVEYGAAGAAAPVLGGTAVTLSFNDAAARVTGNGGCNDYSGSCLIEDNSMTVSNLGSTKKACTDPPGIMTQESAYFEMLGKAERFELKGGGLTIYCSGSRVLVFERITAVANLSSTSWSLASYGPASQQKSLLPSTSITLVFDAGAEHFSGNASVNSYGGDCAVLSDALTISNLYQTEMASNDPPGIMQQEADYLTLLAKAERFEATCCGLTIYCAGGAELRFLAD